MSTVAGPRSVARDARGFPRFWDEERETRDPRLRDAVILDEKADVTESSYAAQLRHLVDVLPDGPSPLRAADAVRTMELVDDVYRAAGLQPR